MCSHSISHLLIRHLCQTNFPTKLECVIHINANVSWKRISNKQKQHQLLADAPFSSTISSKNAFLCFIWLMINRTIYQWEDVTFYIFSATFLLWSHLRSYSCVIKTFQKKLRLKTVNLSVNQQNWPLHYQWIRHVCMLAFHLLTVANTKGKCLHRAPSHWCCN